MASGGLSMGDAFGWREPSLLPARSTQLAQSVARWQEEGARIVLASDQSPRLAELLAEGGHPVGVSDRLPQAPPPGAIALIERSLNGGFAGGPDGLVFVTDRELFGSVRVRRPRALRRVVPRDLLERLTPGRPRRPRRPWDRALRADARARRGRRGARLPRARVLRRRQDVHPGRADQPSLALLGRGEPAALEARWRRLGADEARVKKAVSDLAEDLLELYSSRNAAEGHAFGQDTPWQQEMEAAFPYEETPDQLRASAEAKLDMEAGRPMDRLVVGDVGYGKTEVALRAAFKATQDGKQVAVLVPDDGPRGAAPRRRSASASRRSRCRSAALALRRRSKDQETALAGLADGIGRHRDRHPPAALEGRPLPGPRARRRRRGAALRRRRTRSASSSFAREVDVLTLSATPIPRTLNLALAGVRDMSVIETPPEDRLPIQTRVAEASAGLVRDAILRELDRGGQVFYVHNRVETIEAQAEQLRQMLPGARIAVGHGQMAEGRARAGHDRLCRGRERRARVHDDHRVGPRHPQREHDHHRPRRHARACPALPAARPRRPIVAAARTRTCSIAGASACRTKRRKRLQAIFNASELGAGFQIALADLEIRGAGNILGAEQIGSHGRCRVRPVQRGCSPRRSRSGRRTASIAGPSSRSRRRSSTCRSKRICRTTTCPRSPRSSSCTGGSPVRAPGATRRLPPGAHRPVRTAAGARGPAARGGRAALVRGVGRDRVRVARGEPARRPHRHAPALGGDARARRPSDPRRPDGRHHLRLQPGPHPAPEGSPSLVDRHAGRRHAPRRSRRVVARAGGRHVREQQGRQSADGCAASRTVLRPASVRSASLPVRPRSSMAARSPSGLAAPSRSATTRWSSRTISSSSPRRSRSWRRSPRRPSGSASGHSSSTTICATRPCSPRTSPRSIC